MLAVGVSARGGATGWAGADSGLLRAHVADGLACARTLISEKPRGACPTYGLGMIKGIDIISVWVLDQDSACRFYTEKLGFELTNDVKLENGMRWLTVRPPGSTGQEWVLMDPLHSMLDAETAKHVRALVAKGALSPGVISTSDCRADHAALAARGVEFTQPPADRPYGVEAVMRDDSGNWFSFTERKAWGA
jgi:catechol 2,3-dioxygenase-like lactoylglutathione lyase family enzyme